MRKKEVRPLTEQGYELVNIPEKGALRREKKKDAREILGADGFRNSDGEGKPEPIGKVEDECRPLCH